MTSVNVLELPMTFSPGGYDKQKGEQKLILINDQQIFMGHLLSQKIVIETTNKMTWGKKTCHGNPNKKWSVASLFCHECMNNISFDFVLIGCASLNVIDIDLDKIEADVISFTFHVDCNRTINIVSGS